MWRIGACAGARNLSQRIREAPPGALAPSRLERRRIDQSRVRVNDDDDPSGGGMSRVFMHDFGSASGSAGGLAACIASEPVAKAVWNSWKFASDGPSATLSASADVEAVIDATVSILWWTTASVIAERRATSASRSPNAASAALHFLRDAEVQCPGDKRNRPRHFRECIACVSGIRTRDDCLALLCCRFR